MTDIQEPRVRVLIDVPGVDGLKQVDVQTDNRDRVRWDIIRGRKGWPEAKEAPSLWMTILAWNALRRSGEPVGDDPASNGGFLDQVVGVYAIDENGELVKPHVAAGTNVDPTQQAAEPGS